MAFPALCGFLRQACIAIPAHAFFDECLLCQSFVRGIQRHGGSIGGVRPRGGKYKTKKGRGGRGTSREGLGAVGGCVRGIPLVEI